MNPSKITSELAVLIKQQTLQYDIIEGNLKKLKTEIKNSKKENYKNAIERLITEMKDKEWQRMTKSCEYINSNWSFKLVDVTSNYRIWIRTN